MSEWTFLMNYYDEIDELHIKNYICAYTFWRKVNSRGGICICVTNIIIY